MKMGSVILLLLVGQSYFGSPLNSEDSTRYNECHKVVELKESIGSTSNHSVLYISDDAVVFGLKDIFIQSKQVSKQAFKPIVKEISVRSRDVADDGEQDISKIVYNQPKVIRYSLTNSGETSVFKVSNSPLKIGDRSQRLAIVVQRLEEILLIAPEFTDELPLLTDLGIQNSSFRVFKVRPPPYFSFV